MNGPTRWEEHSLCPFEENKNSQPALGLLKHISSMEAYASTINNCKVEYSNRNMLRCYNENCVSDRDWTVNVKALFGFKVYSDTIKLVVLYSCIQQVQYLFAKHCSVCMWKSSEGVHKKTQGSACICTIYERYKCDNELKISSTKWLHPQGFKGARQQVNTESAAP